MIYIIMQLLLIAKGDRNISIRLIYLTIVTLIGLSLLVAFSLPYMILVLETILVIPSS